MRTEYLNSAELIFVCVGLACMYAAKYNLARLGVFTGAGWGFWPPRRWEIVEIWRAAQHVEEGAKGMLLFWAVMMWVAALLGFGLLPFVLYFTYRSLVA